MIPGLTYIPNFITDIQQDYVISEIDKQPWSNELKRRVQHYGYKYAYTNRSIDVSMKTQDLTRWMLVYAKRFVDANFFDQLADQVIINEYAPGQGIYRHIDCTPCFKDSIASISLLSGCIMEFVSKQKEAFELYLEPKSLLVLSGEARYDWYHGIPMRKSDNGTPRTRRVSITFRNVIL